MPCPENKFWASSAVPWWWTTEGATGRLEENTHTQKLKQITISIFHRWLYVHVCCRLLQPWLPVQDESTGRHQRYWYFCSCLCFLVFSLNSSLPLYYHACVMSWDLPFHEMGGASTAVTGKRLRTWLLQLRNAHCLFRESPLIDTVLDGYNKARHGAEVGASQYNLP